VDLSYFEAAGHPYHLAAERRPRKGEYLFRLKDGCRRWWFIVEAVLGPDRFMAVANDTTERKLAEAEVERLNAELEQRVSDRTARLEAANKELEAFSYSVSHALRAPLRGIDGWSAALLEDYGEQLDEQAHIYLQRVRAEAQRMGRLIDGILQLSRLTRAPMELEEVNLSEMAQSVALRLLEAYPDRPVEVVIEPGLRSRGDPDLLQVALANLIDNALKFTRHNLQALIEFGQVEVQSDPQAPAEAVYFVRDNGAGFDMNYAKKLFGAFQRMHKESEFPGSGIGLATVQRIIHRHGGRVWAEAAPNRGATFYFTLEGQE